MVADMRQQGGFTLIELLTAFSLLLIVLMYSVLDIGRHIRQIGYQSALQQLRPKWHGPGVRLACSACRCMFVLPI